MLKRKRSLLAGGLTSSCRIKAEALARAFNSRIWPCAWRSTPVRRQDDDEEFYDTSPIEDDDWGGRGPDRSAATEEGRAKLYELLQQHAVDDATDVFYDVSEHADGGPDTEGKVSERFKMDGILMHDVILHEPSETSNGIWTNGESASKCSNLENGHDTSNGTEADRDSYVEASNYNGCQISSGINNDKQSSIECSNHDGCQTSNGMKECEQASIDCSKYEDWYGTSSDNDPSCMVDEQPPSESPKHGDVCEPPNSATALDKSPTEGSECDRRCETFSTMAGRQSSTESLKIEHGCETCNGLSTDKQSSSESSTNEFSSETSNMQTQSSTEITNSTCEPEYVSNQDCDDRLINCDSAETAIPNCSVECFSNQEYPSVGDSGNKIDIPNTTEYLKVTPVSEALNSPDSLDLSVNFDSDYYAKSESTDTETTSLTNSFECEQKISANVFLNTNAHTAGIQNFETNDNFSSVGNTNEENVCTNFSNNLNSDNLCSCINNIDKPSNQLHTFEHLSNSSIEHLNSSNSQTIKDPLDHSKSATMDFVDHSGHFDKEEILTVIIDSNLFNIHQSETYNLDSGLLSDDQCANLPNHIPAPPEFSSSNSDSEATTTMEVSDNLHLIKDINDANCSCLQNGCDKISVLNCQGNISGSMNNSEQEAIISLNELDNPDVSKGTNEVYLRDEFASLENTSGSSSNNDKEEIISLNEKVSIKVTNEGSPIHDNSKNTRLDFMETTSTDEACRLKVFDEHRPMISRSTSLKTGKTPPGTPSRKKIVRFADVLGLDLEDVRHIVSGDLPNIPSSAYSDLALGSDPFPTTVVQSVTVELNCRQQASWECVPGLVGPNALYPLFAIPGQQPDFMERVRSGGVCLEGLVIEDCNVQCTCRVMNWGYNKRVVARYTTNGWSTSCDINASYVSDSTRDGTDSFAFNIFLGRDRSDLQFALRYEINGNEYWDNNFGKNYCFSYHSNNISSQTTEACSPTWMGQFW